MSMIGWNQNNILKLQIDHTKVDEDLFDFPVLVNLTGAGSGINNTTMSGVFNELGLYATVSEVGDSFIGTSPTPINTTLWDTSNGSSFSLNNNTLFLNHTSGGTDEWQTIDSKYYLVGDFDIQIDFDTLTSPANNENNTSFLVIGEDGVSYGLYLRHHTTSYRYIITQPYTVSATDVHTSGKFRLVRSGTSLKAYYWDPGAVQWEWDGNTAGGVCTFIDGPVYVMVSCKIAASTTRTTSYDNFVVNSAAEVIWLENNRKKLAFVYPSVQEHQTYVFDDYTTVMLKSDGGTSFTDSSAYRHSLAITGAVTHSTTQSKFGNTSVLVADTNSYLTILNSTETCSFGTDAFTIDAWVYITENVASQYGHLFMLDDQTTGTFKYSMFASNIVKWYYYSTTFNSATSITSATMSNNAWHHVAFVVYAGDFYIYIDGILKGSTPTTEDFSCATAAYMFKPNSAEYFDGHVDEFRVSKGIARWVTVSGMPASFDPPTGPYEGTVPETTTYIHGSNEQLYCEIERWDQANEEAQLWVKVPRVLSNQPTDLFLYYDKTQEDNISYVDDTGEHPALQVWDENFVVVYHMSQDPSGTAPQVLDSTQLPKDLTSYGTMTSSDLVDANVGKGIVFDDVNDYLQQTTLAITNDITVEFEGICSASAATDIFVADYCSSGDSGWFMYIGTDGKLSFQGRSHTGGGVGSPWTLLPYDDGVNHYLVGKRTGSVWSIDVDGGVEYLTTDSSSTASIGDANYFTVGGRRDCTGAATYFAPITVGELRVSNISRSNSWVRSTNYSNKDTLISYLEADICAVTGYVKELDVPVARTVYLYDRVSGELMGKTTSDPTTGYYSVTTTSSGSHHVVALDDDALPDFDDLIISKVTPIKVI